MSKIKKTNSPIKNLKTAKRQSKTSNEDGMFEFFAQIVKLKILNMGDADVIYKYSSWLKALRQHSDDRVKCDYVKLLVMGLEHATPVYPFNDFPPDYIEPIEGEWIAKARDIFCSNGPSGRPVALNPAIATSVSDDKRQFAAYQTIPGAGLQCYYAQSDEPLHEWFFKSDSKLKQPANAVQAIPLEWERSLAGIRKAAADKQLSDPTTKNIENQPDHCKILETDQENLGIEIGFKWNVKSLLTGDTIPGADCCIDWLIHEHEKTQLEIDEEIIRVFDKLYPDNFRLSASPELLEGIIKKMDDKKVSKCEEYVKPRSKSPTQPRQCAGYDRNSLMSLERLSDYRLSEDNSSTASIQDGRMSIYDSELQIDDISLTEKYENYSSIIQPTYDNYPKSDMSYRIIDELPSFVDVAKSFNYLADKAEKTMREVNDWLTSK